MCLFSRMWFWCSLVFFGIVGCLSGFLGFLKKTFGKTKTQQSNNKPISKGGSETFKHFVFVYFPEGMCLFSLVVFSICGVPLVYCCLLSKNIRENQKKKQTNPYPRVGLKPLKCLCCVVFPKVFFFVFFGYLW